MRLRTKITLFNGFVLALTLLAAAVAAVGFWLALAPLRQAVADEARALSLADALRNELAREEAGVSLALASGGAGGAGAYGAADARFNELLAQAAQLPADTTAREALEAARGAEAAFNRQADLALAQGEGPTEALRLLVEQVLPARAAADAALDRFLERQAAAARAAERQAARGALLTTAAFVALLAAAGVGGAALSLRLSRDLLDRLSALVHATGLVAAGGREARVPAPAAGGDELDLLSRAFNHMVARLSEAEAAARRVDDLKASFLASVSHDLRTPLTTVRGLLETLRREDVSWDEASRREFLELAARESERLVRLVTNLLDLSRLEAGAWPLEFAAVELPAVARTLIDDLSGPGGPLEGRPVALRAATAATAWADELQVRRVLENLLTNAVKFSPAGTRIQVEIDRAGAAGPPAASGHAGPRAPLAAALGSASAAGSPGGAIAVRVRDRGPGVPEGDELRVFEKFYRARTTYAGAPGTGLGLAICRAVVEAHGGRIWAEPGPQGQGATFGFTLPAAPPAIPDIPEPPGGSGKRTPAAGAARSGASVVEAGAHEQR